MPKMTAQQELFAVARQQGWEIVPISKGRVSFVHRRRAATAEFDSHQRLRAAAIRQPSPPRQNLGEGPAEDQITYLSNHRRERLLAFFRGEKFEPEPVTT
jgi:hypothetical protein